MKDAAQHMVDVITEHRARQPRPGSYIMTPAEFRSAVEKLGGVTKASHSLGCSRSTVYRWMKTGVKHS